MIDKEALAKLIKTFSLEQTDLACRMVILADSRSAPEELTRLLRHHQIILQLIKHLLKMYVADDPVAMDLLDEGLYRIALSEMLAFENIAHSL